MKKKAINIYEFKELKKDIQDRLIEEERQEQVNDFCNYFLQDEMEEKAKELLKNYFGNKATFKNVYYDLSYCQGSGAMIEFDLKYYNEDIEIKHCGSYSHENSFNYLYNFNEKRAEKLNAKIRSMNIELQGYGYKMVDDKNWSNEDIIDNLICNEYMADGSLFIY